MGFRRTLSITAVVGAVLAILAGLALHEAPEAPNYVRGQNETVLFLSLAESGQINVELATCQALMEHHPNIKIHMASFSGVTDKVARVSSYGVGKSPSAQEITFHEIPGLGRIFSLCKQLGCEEKSVGECLMHPPGVRGVEYLAKQLEFAVWAWPGEEHEAIYEHIKGLIQQVNPAVVIVEQSFRPALDATQKLNWNYAIMTPLAVADLFSPMQPYGAMFWKYPFWGTGFSFPVPWAKIPENIYITARILYTLLARPCSTDTLKYLKSRDIDTSLAFDPYADSTLISQTLPGASIPMEVLPKNVVQAGVILLESGSAAEQDAVLLDWLKQASTVVINLGSLFKYSEDRAKTMAEAIHIVLSNLDVQILWKLAGASEIGDDSLLPLDQDLRSGRVRIMEWLSIDTLTLLSSGYIVLSVHHGGSSSYNEAISAGVPQVVFPMWQDHYNYAQLVESLGVGLYGCRETAPNWTVDGLTVPVLKMLNGDDKSERIQEEAKRLGELARKKPGRYVSAEVVAKLATLSVSDLETDEVS